LPAGERGEIVARGPLVSLEYFELPDATAEAHRDGWHHTGDVGYRDKAGYFYIVDRKKDMIITGGFNVYPAEVEQVLHQHPAVQDCAVFGVPDDKWGECVTAVVEMRAGASPEPEEMQALARERLGPVKTHKALSFTTKLPRSNAGKVLRAELRKPYWQARDRAI
ncbi:MAG: hypothetical protein JWO33_1474, partial [Caulobacteraceae bacterium]|nr:hypothetical protein [Caulobacteraceae bacterium]